MLMVPSFKSAAKALVAFAMLATSGALSRADAASVDMQVVGITPTPTQLVAGGDVTFDVAVENGWSNTATNATATITLPSAVDFTSVSVSGAAGASCIQNATNPKQVDCSFPSLAGTQLGGGDHPLVQILGRTNIDGVVNVTVKVAVGPGDIDVNTGPTGNDLLTKNFTIVPGANLFFETFTTSSPTIVSSGTATYTGRIKNLGPNAAVNASVMLTLPPGLTFVSSASWVCTPGAVTGSGQTVSCSYGSSVVVGAYTPDLVFDVRAVSTSTGSLSVAGQVTSATADGVPNNNLKTVGILIAPGTDLAMSKSINPASLVNGTLLAGQSATFNLTVDNLGVFDASGLMVVDTFPPNFTITGPTNGGSVNGWLCTITGSVAAGQKISCERPTLVASSSSTIPVIVTAPSNPNVPVGNGLNLINVASVSSTSNDAVASNNSGQVAFTVVRDAADLAIGLSRSPGPVAVGSDVTSTINATNYGPRSASGTFQSSYQLVAGEAYKGFSGAGWSCPAVGTVAPGGIVTCTYTMTGSLAVNATSGNLTLTTSPSAAGNINGTVCVSGSAGMAPAESDPNTANDCSNIGVVASGKYADLRLTKSRITKTLSPTR
jgi:large repetitive protein